MDSIIIKPGGKVYRKDWVYDRKKKKGKWVEKDITDNVAFYLLWPTCKIEKGVTLHDIFTILKRNIDLYKVVINNWVDEIVKEGLSPCDLPTDPNIKCVEVYWCLSYDEDSSELYGDTLFPCFHGVSTHKDKIPYSLMYTPANKLADKPLRIGKALIGPDIGKAEEWMTFRKCNMSLLQILYAIVFELSWSGSPKQRDKKKKKLDKICKKIKKDKK